MTKDEAIRWMQLVQSVNTVISELVNGYLLTRLVCIFLKTEYDARPMNFGDGEPKVFGNVIGISLRVGTLTCA